MLLEIIHYHICKTKKNAVWQRKKINQKKDQF